jgi:ATP-dependent DNA ligase
MPLALPLSYAPMDAKLVSTLPVGPNWQYEPKWDGFRCLAFRDGARVNLQSKSGQSLGRYFPEIVDALSALKARQFILDGELVVPQDNALSFDALLQRIHPAASRIKMLSEHTPAMMICFDLLVDEKGHAFNDRTIK